MEQIPRSSARAGVTVTERPIKGWPGYFITDRGRVLGPKGDKAQSTMKKSGHKYVSFWRDGKAHKEYVHRLVASHFIGNIPAGMQVCHGPGGPADNRLENIRIDTPKGNALDRRRDRTEVRGEDCWNAKLTQLDVDYIRSRRGEYRGVQRELASEFGVSESRISVIMRGLSWADY